MKAARGQPLTLRRIYANCRLPEGGCKLWKGGANKGGYPFLYDPAIYASGAHKTGMVSGRIAVWRIKHGTAPHGHKMVMTCGNRLCLAHEHMQPMTFAAAQRFAAQAGAYSSLRHCVARITNSRSSAKLTREKAQRIRADVLAGAGRQEQADLYGVSRSTVDQIVRGTRWGVMLAPNASVFTQAA